MVLVKKNSRKYWDNQNELQALIRALPRFVAEALTVPGTEGELTSKDVEVYVSDFGPLDVHTCEIEITVFANDYLQRRKNLDERKDALIGLIRENLKNIENGSVWILLCPGSYGTF